METEFSALAFGTNEAWCTTFSSPHSIPVTCRSALVVVMVGQVLERHPAAGLELLLSVEEALGLGGGNARAII